MSVYRIDNFHKGMIPDAALVETRPVLHTIKNFRYIYDGDVVRLCTRKGFTKFNAVDTAYPIQQLYVYRDLENNEHILGIMYDATNPTYNRWYRIAKTGSHVAITDEHTTARQHIIDVDGRVFFGTDGDGADTGWRWADNTSIVANTSYRVGIKKPSGELTLARRANDGRVATPDPSTMFVMNKTTQRYLAFPFVAPRDMDVGNVRITTRAFAAAPIAAQTPGA